MHEIADDGEWERCSDAGGAALKQAEAKQHEEAGRETAGEG